jgi:hypothetical protein
MRPGTEAIALAQGRTTIIVRGAPKRPVKPRRSPLLTDAGPPIAIAADAERASRILARIEERCPELSRDDFLLVARVLADAQRAKDSSPKKAAAKRATPAKRRA